MNKTLKPLTAVLGASFLASAVVPAAQAETANPFAITELSSGYQLAGSEGKCGEGKCGEKDKDGEGKCGEGKCGEKDDKDAEGKCGEGKCGEKDKDGEGKCGEGKCGG